MKRLLRRPDFFLLLGLVASAHPAAALTPTEWEHRQTVVLAAPGLTKIAVPAATFDAAQPDLADIRLIAASGQEIPYLLDRDLTVRGQAGFEPVHPIQPASFHSEAAGGMTQLILATGSKAPLDALDLETSAPYFLKAAHVDISADGEKWESLGAAVPLFRQFGAEQLQLPLDRKTAAFVRVTLDDNRTRPIAFTGARLRPAPQTVAPALSLVGAQIERREEFAGETVLTVALAGRQIPLAELHLEVPDPLFMRRATVSIREVRGGISGERIIGAGTLYRVALEGSSPRAQLEIPVSFSPPAREVLVHIFNGDSPPLDVHAVEARQHAVNLLFMAPSGGAYTLLSGNPQASAPRYDLAVFAGEMRAASAAPASVGGIEATPNYRPREPLVDASLSDIPLTGAILDSKDWPIRRPVQLVRTGVQELQLDPEALAQTRSDFADVRLLRGGNQIPYILEQPALSRSLTIAPVAAADPKRPSVSVWRLTLPQSGLPLQRLVIVSTTPLFQRHFRLYEKWTGRDGGAFENTLATGDWSRTPEPGMPESRVFELGERPRTTTLLLETDNGDNPAVTLGPVQVVYPVVRLVFKVAATDSLTLAYGNKTATAPRYDLSLVAMRLLTASRSPAVVAAGDPNAATAGNLFDGLHGGALFWIALALVVVVLLVVVARLLPKVPPSAG